MVARSLLSISGTTTDGKQVCCGIFRFYETFGLPFDVIFDSLTKHNSLPDWIDLYITARDSGMSHRSITSKLADPVSDVYGSEFSTVVLERLEKFKLCYDLDKTKDIDKHAD